MHALLAALIVHSANDASIVLAHATMGQPAAQAAAAKEARRLGRALPRRSRRALRPAHERRGAQARPARHGLPHAARARRARRALLGARRAHARARRHGLADLQRRSPARRTVSIPGHRLQTSNTLLSAYAGLDGVKTGHTDEAGWNLAASADRGGMRMYVILLGAPDEASRDRDIARLLDWGFDRYKRARLVRAGQPFGHAGSVRVDRGEGARRSRSIRASSVRERDRAAAPPRPQGERRRAARLRRAAQRARRARARVAGRRQRRRRHRRRSCRGCARASSSRPRSLRDGEAPEARGQKGLECGCGLAPLSPCS